MRLARAWQSTSTTTAERDKMVEILKATQTGQSFDYAKTAENYFTWRAAKSGETFDYLAVKKREEELAHGRIVQDQARGARMRKTAEDAVRRRLVDPNSAMFEWNGDFAEGTWKPFLAKRVSGWIGCGVVNSKNRMGGYSGGSAFVVVMNDNTVSFLDMDGSNSKGPLVQASCLKMTFPPIFNQAYVPPTAMPVSSTGSVADELGKLVALRDKGVLTDAEFAAQKAKLLAK
jgi:hypothetical protein